MAELPKLRREDLERVDARLHQLLNPPHPQEKPQSQPSGESLSTAELRPFTPEECRLAYEVPNPEFDELEHHCASLPKRLPEPD
jgi:hypothetical protein